MTQGPTKWFPRSLSNPSTGSVPSYAPATSPRLRRSPSPWPPGRRCEPAQKFPSRPKPAGSALQPSPYPSGLSWRIVLRSILPLVPRVHLPVSLAGPAPSDSAGAFRRCQGCVRLRRCPPGQAALSFNRSAATDRWRWSLTTARFNSASWRSTPAIHRHFRNGGGSEHHRSRGLCPRRRLAHFSSHACFGWPLPRGGAHGRLDDGTADGRFTALPPGTRQRAWRSC